MSSANFPLLMIPHYLPVPLDGAIPDYRVAQGLHTVTEPTDSVPFGALGPSVQYSVDLVQDCIVPLFSVWVLHAGRKRPSGRFLPACKKKAHTHAMCAKNMRVGGGHRRVGPTARGASQRRVNQMDLG